MLNTLGDTRSDYSTTLVNGIKTNQPKSGGLYVPQNGSLPVYSEKRLRNLEGLPYQETANDIMGIDNFDLGLNAEELTALINDAYGEQWHRKEIVSLEEVSDKDNLYSLHLGHGPTFAFKNVALEFLARYLSKVNSRIQIALGASSGDTINAAHYSVNGLDNMRSIFLLPQKGPSEVQRLQAIANDIQNAMTILINGDFDDAQSVIKLINTDKKYKDFKEENNFMTFNSIQILRIIAQIVYYFRAYNEMVRKGAINFGDEIDFSVPSANFGDALAGLYAKEMGLPIRKINIATNENDMLHQFLEYGVYEVKLDENGKRKKAVITKAPSQDITISSNFERALYWATGGNYEKIAKRMNELNEKGKFKVDPETLKKLRSVFTSSRSSDVEIEIVQKEVYDRFGEIIDTHSATGFKPYILDGKAKVPTVCIQTAHAVQFKSPEGVPDTTEYQDIVEKYIKRGKTVKEGVDYLECEADPKSIQDAVVKAICAIESRI